MNNPAHTSLALALLLGGVVAQGPTPATPPGPAPAAGALLELRVLAAPGYESGGVSFDMAAERERLTAWLAADENAQRVRRDPWSVERFNGLATDAGGSVSEHLRWYPHVIRPRVSEPRRWEFAYGVTPPIAAVRVFELSEYQSGPTAATKRLVELLPVNLHAPGFTASDLDGSSVAVHEPTARGPEATAAGYPVVEFAVREDRRDAFAAWTEEHVGGHMAVIVRRELRAAPRLMARIARAATIAANFTDKEAEELATDLKAKAAGAAAATSVIVPDGGGAVPTGTDPADLRAMQGAQAMLAAEERLRNLIKSGKISGIDRILTFEEISSWPYEDGLLGIPKQVEKLDGKNVLMTGFMLPIDEVEDIKEFLLVQSLWSCCFGQPPDINGFVRVVMKGDARIDYQFDPIKITGTFKVEATSEDGYCVDIYQLIADSVEVIH